MIEKFWKKIEVIDRTHLRWSSTCDQALQCPLQEAGTDFPQVFQGRKTTTRFLADATTLLSGRGREDPTILEALWWGVLLLGQISFLDFVFCFCVLTLDLNIPLKLFHRGLDDLADAFAGSFTVTNTPNDTNRPHPR